MSHWVQEYPRWTGHSEEFWLYIWTSPDGQYEIRVVMFFAVKDGEALYNQQKQDLELTVAQIMSFLLPKFRLKLKKVEKTTRSFRYVLCFVAQLCPTLCDHRDWAHQAPFMGILQARILERVASSRGSPPGIEPRSPALQADCLPSESPGKFSNTWVDNLSLLQRIFLTQRSNQGLLHCRQILYQLSYQGNFISQLFVKPSQWTTLPSWISFLGDGLGHCLL